MASFFISYTASDRSWAEWIASVLEEEDFETVLQAWDFPPGANWMDEMSNATEKADRTIAVLSPQYLKSRYCRVEWLARLAQDPLGTERRLLPLVVKTCKLPLYLQTIVHVNMVGLGELEARRALLNALRHDRVALGIEAVFPHQQKVFEAAQSGFPGRWPLVWTVDRIWNRDFTGRENYLKKLRTDLVKGDPSASSIPQAIHGLGGVGKTALALEYVYRYRHLYCVVHWINGGDTSQLMQDYANLALELELELGADIKPRSASSAVRRWLEGNRHWLLVFDNADGPDDLASYLPRSGTGHVIITTRNPEWLGVARAVELHVLSLEEAVAFIRKGSLDEHADEIAAATLARALGCLPLALAQARAYVHTRRLSVSDYLRVFNKFGRKLLQRGEPPRGCEATVETCWAISIAATAKKMPDARELLKLLSFLAPQDLPRDLPEKWPDCLPRRLEAVAKDYLILQDCFAELWRYSLVQLTERAVSVHPMIQMVTRQEIPPEEKATWADAAMRLVENAFPEEPDDPRELPTCHGLITHALVAAEHSEKLCSPTEVAGRLLYRVGLYLRSIGDFPRSKTILEKALVVLQIACGPNHHSTSKVLDLIGGVFMDMGDPRGAVEKRRQALEIMRSCHSDRDPALVPALLSLARSFRQLRELGETVKLLKEAFTIETGIDIGDVDTRTLLATAVEGVGTVVDNAVSPSSDMALRDDSHVTYLDVGRDFVKGIKSARRQSCNLQKNVIAAELNPGPNARIMLSILNMVGLVLIDLNDYVAAHACFKQMKQILEQFPNPRKRQRWLARVLNNLGSVQRRLGDLNAAQENFRKSIEIVAEYYGSNHHTVATRFNNLGSVLSELGRMEEARECFEKALKIFLKRYEEGHARVQTVRRHLECIEMTCDETRRI